MSARARPGSTLVFRGLLALVLVGIAVAVLLPHVELEALRGQYAWFNAAISRTERLWPAVDMVHLLMFGVLGLVLVPAFPARRWPTLAGLVVVLAAVSELSQFWVPGRAPAWSDFALDVVAAGVAAALVIAVRGRARARLRARPESGSH